MADAHTPAPWLYRSKSEAVYTAPSEGSVCQYGKQISRFDEDATPSEADLNLILAAPELLEALRELVAGFWGVLVESPEGNAAVDRARAAITKATWSPS